MISVSYVSKSQIAGNLGEVLAIRDAAIEHNRKIGVTGCLYCDSNFFFQILEGRRADVMNLLRKVCRDTRHSDIRVIDGLEITKRRFGDSSMKLVNGISNQALSNSFTREGFQMCDRHFLAARINDLESL